jgi:autotransporter-associated beta strand protein
LVLGDNTNILSPAINNLAGFRIEAGQIIAESQYALTSSITSPFPGGPVEIQNGAGLVLDLGFDANGNGNSATFKNNLVMQGTGVNGSGALIVSSGNVTFTSTTINTLLNDTTISIPDPNSSLLIDGNIGEKTISSGITKTGPGLLTLKPLTFNTTTGDYLIESGPVKVTGGDNPFGSGTNNKTGLGTTTTIADGAGLIITPSNAPNPNKPNELKLNLYNNFIVGGAGFVAPANTNAVSTKGVIEVTGASLGKTFFSNITGNLTLTNSITIDVATGSELTIDGVVDEDATGVKYNITKTGGGILRLTGSSANLLDGNIIVDGGAVEFG